MPELPDITAYISALEARIVHQTLQHVRLGSPFLLRTVQPPIGSARGADGSSAETDRQTHRDRTGGGSLDRSPPDDCWTFALAKMLRRKLGGRQNLAAFDFPNGTLLLTEAGSKQRASLHLIAGEANLASLDAGGIDVFSSDLETFRSVLTAENHTLKRALTDPRLLSGIGNAYSDEILHAAQLSPITMTKKLTDEEWQRLYDATRQTLKLWISKLGADAERRLPGESHSIPQRHGDSRTLRPALSPVRRQNTAHPICRQRNELLRPLPDGRQSSRRPEPVTSARLRLAAHLGRTGSPETALIEIFAFGIPTLPVANRDFPYSHQRPFRVP